VELRQGSNERVVYGVHVDKTVSKLLSFGQLPTMLVEGQGSIPCTLVSKSTTHAES
jgi:hypothetical protein